MVEKKDVISQLKIVEKDEFIVKISKELDKALESNNIENIKSKVFEVNGMIRMHQKIVKKSWREFELIFEELNENFTIELIDAFPELTPAQVKLCQLLRLDLSTKKIADLLSIHPRSVDRSRYEIRKIFGLKKDESITRFLAQLN